MELHHWQTGRGMQHEAAIKRAAIAAMMRRMEEEQIVWVERGKCMLNNSPSQPRLGGGEEVGCNPDGTGTWAARGRGDAATAGLGGGSKQKGSINDSDKDYGDRDNLNGGGGGGNGDAAGGSGVGGGGGGIEGKEGTPSKRKGEQGKKPPTLIMHTMAGRNPNVRELMRGIM